MISNRRQRATKRFAPFASLRARVVAWNILILALLLGVFGATLPFGVRSAMMASVDRDLINHARRYVEHPPPDSGLRPPMPRGDRPEPPDDKAFGEDQDPFRMRPPMPIDGGGRGRRGGPPSDDSNYRPRAFFQKAGIGKKETPWSQVGLDAGLKGDEDFRTIVVNEEPLRVYTLPFRNRDQGQGAVQVAYSLSEVYRAVSGLVQALALFAPLALLCAGLGGFLLTGRALRPVLKITAAAKRISADALSQRLPMEGDDEFTQLAATFNGMLGRLEAEFGMKQDLIARLRELVEQQRRFTADASHELRTPLTVIKANASLTLLGETSAEEFRQAMQEVDVAAAAMARLVDDLLLLARSDSGQLARNRIELSLEEPVSQAIARVRRPERARIVLKNDSEAPLMVRGCEDEITRVFINLLENAARYTPPQGEITVSLRREGDFAVAEVRDTGCGIAPEHLAHLGERFYRVDSARARKDGGFGLGVAICRSLVEAHGGTLTYQSVLGDGTQAMVCLPLVKEEASAVVS